MIDWRPTSNLSVARARARMLESARKFFGERDVLEISTPILSRAAVSDPYIESIGAGLGVEPGTDFFLRTSPEFCMKRLLSAGFPDIYEIGNVFRDGEAGRRHQPEFTMVEWYRHGFGLAEIIDDTVDFIRAVLPQDRFMREARRQSYQEAYLEFAGIDPLKADIRTIVEASGTDDQLQSSLGPNRDDWLNLILAEKVVPGFARDRLTVLYHYPASQGALARLCPHDDSVADRFEIFCGDLELANGYVELTDEGEQRRRYGRDQLTRETKDLALRPLDENFLAALESGLPPCAGVAVGFDRLVMLNQNAGDIREVLTFAYRRQP